jgi:hypothetical protein
LLGLIASSVKTPALPDSQVRLTLLAALSTAEREALCGGMDVSPYLKPTEEFEPIDHMVAVGQLIGSFRIQAGGAGQCFPAGWPSFLEFKMESAIPGRSFAAWQGGLAAHVLYLPCSPGRQMELWWTDEVGTWSETRSIRWRLDPSHPARASAISLDRLPHWSSDRAQRIRVMFRTAGQTTVRAPRLLR